MLRLDHQRAGQRHALLLAAGHAGADSAPRSRPRPTRSRAPGATRWRARPRRRPASRGRRRRSPPPSCAGTARSSGTRCRGRAWRAAPRPGRLPSRRIAPRARLEETRDHLQRRGLAAAGRAEQRDELPFSTSSDRRSTAACAAELRGQAVQREEGLPRRRGRPPQAKASSLSIAGSRVRRPRTPPHPPIRRGGPAGSPASAHSSTPPARSPHLVSPWRAVSTSSSARHPPQRSSISSPSTHPSPQLTRSCRAPRRRGRPAAPQRLAHRRGRRTAAGWPRATPHPAHRPVPARRPASASGELEIGHGARLRNVPDRLPPQQIGSPPPLRPRGSSAWSTPRASR